MIGGVRRDVAAGPQGRSENVALGMGLGIFRAHDTTLDELADIGVIASQSRNGFGTNVVETAIADVGEVELAIDDGDGGAGRPHSIELRMLDGVALNALVRRRQGCEQSILRTVCESIFVDVAYGLDGEAAGLLSAFVSAHAIGDHGQAARAEKICVGVGLPGERGIGVVGALAAKVGQAGGDESGFGGFVVEGHHEESELNFGGTAVR